MAAAGNRTDEESATEDPIFALIEESERAEDYLQQYHREHERLRRCLESTEKEFPNAANLPYLRAEVAELDKGGKPAISRRLPAMGTRNELHVNTITALASVIVTQPTTARGHYKKMIYLATHHDFPNHPGIVNAFFRSASMIYAVYGDDAPEDKAVE